MMINFIYVTSSGEFFRDFFIYSDAPSRMTSKLNTWSESSNKRATLSGVAKIALELRKFRWNVEFQEKIFKLEMESAMLVEIRNSDGCNLCFIEYLFIYYAEFDLNSLVYSR